MELSRSTSRSLGIIEREMDLVDDLLGRGAEAYIEDWGSRRALTACLSSIGENAGRLLGAGVAFEVPEVPWRRWKENRNDSSHLYDLIDYAAIWRLALDVATHRSALQALFARAHDYRLEHEVDLDYDPRVLSTEQIAAVRAPVDATCAHPVARTGRACRLGLGHKGHHRSR